MKDWWKYISLTIIISIIWITLFFIATSYFWDEIDYISTGTLIVLTITLIALIIYAYDTHRIANFQERNYFTPSVSYEINATDEGNNSFDIGVNLYNTSPFYVEAIVNIDLRCYNQEIRLPNDVYQGSRPWHLPPNGMLHGHFRLNDELLSQIDRSITELRNGDEDSEMITLTINVECTSRYDIILIIPETRYHFVIDRRQTNGTTWSGWVLDI